MSAIHARVVIALATLAILVTPSFAATETTSLAQLIAAIERDANVSKDILPLERDWIGDIKDDEGKVERIRLEKGRIIKGEITLLRTTPGGYVGRDAPVYIKSIPEDKELRGCATVEELKKLLGAGRPSFSGWGGPNGIHSSHSWVCFSPIAENRLTYVNAFAHTSSNEEQRAKGIKQVNQLTIRRAVLRPADPGNPEESKLYLSGADLFAANEAAKATARQRYPQPLRDLIEVRERPNDSDLKHRSAAIQAIRDAPDPRLFAQLIQEIHEGTLQMRSLLNDILLNQHKLLDLKPWSDKEEAIAINACIDALPLAKDRAKDDLVEILLRFYGGGVIDISGENGGTRIEVALTPTGHTLSLQGSSNRPSLEETQKELRRLYLKSKEEKGAPRKP